MIKLFKRDFSFWWWFVTTVLSTVSVISLVNHMFHVGLAPVFQQMIDFYRDVAHPLIAYLTAWMPPIHPETKDMLIIVLLAGGLRLRVLLAGADTIRYAILDAAILAGSFGIGYLIYSSGMDLYGNGRTADPIIGIPFLYTAMLTVFIVTEAFQSGNEADVRFWRPRLWRYILSMLIIVVVATGVFAVSWQG